MEWRKTTPMKEQHTTFAILHSTYSEIFLYMEIGIMIVVENLKYTFSNKYFMCSLLFFKLGLF